MALGLPSWRRSLDINPGWGCFANESFSRVYFDGVYYRQVMSTRRGIYGIAIPKCSQVPPMLIKLSVFNPWPSIYGLGLHKGYSLLRGNEFRFGYSWYSIDQDVYAHGESIQYPDRPYIPPRSDYFTFDEEMGRLAGIRFSRIVVTDFPF